MTIYDLYAVLLKDVMEGRGNVEVDITLLGNMESLGKFVVEKNPYNSTTLLLNFGNAHPNSLEKVQKYFEKMVIHSD